MLNRIGATAVVSLKLLVRNRGHILASLGLAVISMVVFGALFAGHTGIVLGFSGPAAVYREVVGNTGSGIGWVKSPVAIIVRRVTAGRMAGGVFWQAGHWHAVVAAGDPSVTPIARAVILSVLLRLDGVTATLPTVRTLASHPITTLDWLLPGLLGMLVMWANLYVGAYLANWRQHGLLDRLGVTPLRPAEFLAGQALAQLLFSALECVVFVGLGIVAFGFPAALPWGAVTGWLLVGILTMLALGYALGNLAPTVEGASAAAMLVAFPIMFLGGSYFSVSTLTGTLGALVKWLPLTALNDALRGLMTYRGHETAYGWSHDATVLAAWLIGSAVLAATTFRWSQAH